MRAVTAALGPVSRWARANVKRFLYSGPARARWQRPDRVLAALRPPVGGRVADVGAGGGYFTLRLARAVGPQGRVYALDPDPDMCWLVGRRAARAGLSQVVTVRSEDDRPALPEAVDIALLVDVFHHLPAPRPYLDRLGTCLRPGGRVAVIEALPRWFLFGHATDPQRVRSTMASAGYVEACEHGFLPRQSFLVFRRGHGSGG